MPDDRDDLRGGIGEALAGLIVIVFLGRRAEVCHSGSHAGAGGAVLGERHRPRHHVIFIVGVVTLNICFI